MALGEVAASWLSCSKSSIGTALTWQSNCLPPSPAPRFSFNQAAPWKIQLGAGAPSGASQGASSRDRGKCWISCSLL